MSTSIVAALVAAAVSLLVAIVGAIVTRWTTQQRIQADVRLADRRAAGDLDGLQRQLDAAHADAMSDKAWADYELRRDAYVSLARQIDCLFADGDTSQRPEFHRVARHVRLIGSDDVVRALNDFTRAVRAPQTPNDAERCYRDLFNAMRRDIRRLHSQPAEGTALTEADFPLESS